MAAVRLRGAEGLTPLSTSVVVGATLRLSVQGGRGALERFRLRLTADLLRRAVMARGIACSEVDDPQSADLVLAIGESDHAADPVLVVGVVEASQEDAVGTAERRPELGALPEPEAPSALRYLMLVGHYASPLQVTAAALEGAEAALDRLEQAARGCTGDASSGGGLSETARALQAELHAAIESDLDTPRALATAWTAYRAELSAFERRALLLEIDGLLGLGLERYLRAAEEPLSVEARELIAARALARTARDWPKSDNLREELAALGIETRDSPGGSSYARSAGGA